MKFNIPEISVPVSMCCTLKKSFIVWYPIWYLVTWIIERSSLIMITVFNTLLIPK